MNPLVCESERRSIRSRERQRVFRAPVPFVQSADVILLNVVLQHIIYFVHLL